MNFLKRHWRGIVILFLAGLIMYLTCYYFIPEPTDVRITMPVLIDVVILVFSQIFKMDYGKWPWEMSFRELYNKVIKGKNKRSCI